MNTSNLTSISGWLAAAVIATGSAQAATLSGSFNADDYVTLYLSTDLIASPGEIISDKTTLWGTPQSFSDITLTPGQSVYLLVQARNVFSGPAMFLGDFTITGDGFQFSNGAQNLLSNTVDWTVNETGFDSAGNTPTSLGTNNGLQIWGARPGISLEAEAIWAYYADWSQGYNGPAYFVTQIVAVPEPETWVLLGAGLVFVGAVSRRRRS